MAGKENEHSSSTPSENLRPRNSIHFHGLLHHPYNLEGIQSVVLSFSEFLQVSTGTPIFFMEYGPADTSPSDARKRSDFIRRHGFTGFIAWELLRRGSTEVDDWEINSQVERWRTQSPEQIVTKTPHHARLSIFLSLELDKLKESRDFDVDFEAHPNAVLKVLQQLYRIKTEQEDQVQSFWRAARFQESVDAISKAHLAAFRMHQIREKDIRDYLKNRANKRKKSAGIDYFILMGYLHSPRAGSILTSDQTMVRDSTPDYSEYPDLQIMSSLRAGREIPQVLYARDILHAVILASIVSKIDRRGNFYSLCLNFESISHAIVHLVNQMNMEDVRIACEYQKNFEDVINLIQLPIG